MLGSTKYKMEVSRTTSPTAHSKTFWLYRGTLYPKPNDLYQYHPVRFLRLGAIVRLSLVLHVIHDLSYRFLRGRTDKTILR
jgi:hypothetical protein